MTLQTKHKNIYYTNNCDDCSIVPITDYINNPVFQELLLEEKYLSKFDERTFMDLRDSRGYIDKIKNQSGKNSKLNLN